MKLNSKSLSRSTSKRKPTTWFTSDWHLGHRSIIDHCYRPFKSISEMDDLILRNYFEVVQNDDTVYMLGDFAWAAFYYHSILPSLPGKIYFIPGNHDEKMCNVIKRHVHLLTRLEHYKIDGYRVVLSHYPLESWNWMRYNSYHFHGHCHGNEHRGELRRKPRRYDVGVDVWGFKPVSFETLLKKELYASMKF